MIYIRTLILLVAVLVLGLGCSEKKGATTKTFPDSLIDDQVIARANTQKISGRDLRRYIAIYQAASIDSLSNREHNLRLLDGYIDRLLILQEAEAVGVTISDSTATWFMYEFVKDLGGVARLQAFTAQTGVTTQEIELMIRQDLVVRRFLENEIVANVKVSDALCEQYYDTHESEFVVPDSVHARHILVTTQSGESEEARHEKWVKLESVRARALKGESFEDLALNFSEGPSRVNGGSLGYFTPGDMVKAFSDVAFSLKVGEVSDIVETSFGFHIIRVDDKKPSRKISYQEALPQLRAVLSQQKIGVALKQHLNKTRAVSVIEHEF